MKRTEALHYKLILNGDLFDENPLLISYERREDNKFEDSQLNKGVSLINKWPPVFRIYVQGSQLVDYFLGGPRYHVVSKTVVETIELNLKDGVEFLPVEVLQNETKEKLGAFSIMNILECVDALDWENTIWSTDSIPYGQPDANGKIIKPAFKERALSNHDIFVLKLGKKILSGIYVSKRLKNLLENKSATLGMEFMPIKTV